MPTSTSSLSDHKDSSAQPTWRGASYQNLFARIALSPQTHSRIKADEQGVKSKVLLLASPSARVVDVGTLTRKWINGSPLLGDVCLVGARPKPRTKFN